MPRAISLSSNEDAADDNEGSSSPPRASTSKATSSRQTRAPAVNGHASGRRTRSSASTSATPELPQPTASPARDVPSFAAYKSRPTAGPSTSPPVRRKATPSVAPKARPAAKRKPQLTAEEEERLRGLQQREREQDDFFRRRTQIVFTHKGKQKALPHASTSQSASKTGVSGPAAVRKEVRTLDDDSSSSQSEKQRDSDDPDSDEIAAQRKRKRKSKSDSPAKLLSPSKRIMAPPRPISSSSSSDSGSDSDLSTSDGGDKKGKGKATSPRKKKSKREKEVRPPKQRSLTPIGEVDTFEVAHALQDLRRNAPPIRNYNGDDSLDVFDPRDLDDSNAIGAPLSLNGHASRLTTSLTPLPDERELTEEEKDAKYGHMVTIKVSMVHDPRIEITESNQRGIKRYTAPMEYKIRSRANFDSIFGSVAAEKGIERQKLVFTYNGKTVFVVGTPASLNILSGADFQAYHKELYDYLQARRDQERLRQLQASQQAKLDQLERENSAGAKPSNAIVLESGAGEGGDDDVQLVGPSRGSLTRFDTRSTSQDSPALAVGATSTSHEPSIRLKLRGSSDQVLQVKVPLKRTVATLIKHFLKTYKVDAALWDKARIEFDGESLEKTARLEELDIEDEDTLDIKIPK